MSKQSDWLEIWNLFWWHFVLRFEPNFLRLSHSLSILRLSSELSIRRENLETFPSPLGFFNSKTREYLLTDLSVHLATLRLKTILVKL